VLINTYIVCFQYLKYILEFIKPYKKSISSGWYLLLSLVSTQKRYFNENRMARRTRRKPKTMTAIFQRLTNGKCSGYPFKIPYLVNGNDSDHIDRVYHIRVWGWFHAAIVHGPQFQIFYPQLHKQTKYRLWLSQWS